MNRFPKCLRLNSTPRSCMFSSSIVIRQQQFDTRTYSLFLANAELNTLFFASINNWLRSLGISMWIIRHSIHPMFIFIIQCHWMIDEYTAIRFCFVSIQNVFVCLFGICLQTICSLKNWNFVKITKYLFDWVGSLGWTARLVLYNYICQGKYIYVQVLLVDWIDMLMSINITSILAQWSYWS